MSVAYNPAERVFELGLGVLAASVRDGTEVTIQVRGGTTFCIYKPRAAINVDEDGRILFG